MTPERERELERALSLGIGTGLTVVLFSFLMLADAAWSHCTRGFTSPECIKNGAATLIVLIVLIIMIAVLDKILPEFHKPTGEKQ